MIQKQLSLKCNRCLKKRTELLHKIFAIIEPLSGEYQMYAAQLPKFDFEVKNQQGQKEGDAV